MLKASGRLDAISATYFGGRKSSWHVQPCASSLVIDIAVHSVFGLCLKMFCRKARLPGRQRFAPRMSGMPMLGNSVAM